MIGKAKFNFYLDAIIFAAFLVAGLTGVLFWMLLPEGQGSSRYVFLALRKSSWVDLHNWAGLVMLAGVCIHLLLHWKWIVCAVQRYFRKLARQARINFTLDVFLFGAFVLVNLSGLVSWLILPAGYQGGRNPAYQALWLGFSRHEWSDLHLWSGLAILAIVGVHVSFHWKWILCTIKRATGGIKMAPGRQQQSAQRTP